jgi:hypothetical protein
VSTNGQRRIVVLRFGGAKVAAVLMPALVKWKHSKPVASREPASEGSKRKILPVNARDPR